MQWERLKKKANGFYMGSSELSELVNQNHLHFIARRKERMSTKRTFYIKLTNYIK